MLQGVLPSVLFLLTPHIDHPWEHSLEHPPISLSTLANTPIEPRFPQRIVTGAGGKGPRQKTSKIVKSFKKFFDTFRQLSRRAKNVKNRQKASKFFSTLFDNFRAAPFFRPLLGGADFPSTLWSTSRARPEISPFSTSVTDGLQY